jgi:hypothetical protein
MLFFFACEDMTYVTVLILEEILLHLLFLSFLSCRPYCQPIVFKIGLYCVTLLSLLFPSYACTLLEVKKS